MQRIGPDRHHPLHSVATTRGIEESAAATLPAHALMQRAGEQVARLALAVAPHAHTVWVACGGGNNGGDGLEAAMHLKRAGKQPVVTWLGDEAHAPADAMRSLQRARAQGVSFQAGPPPGAGLCIDALLGIGSGSTRPPEGRMADWIAHMNAGPAPVLAVDLPSALDGDTGSGDVAARARWTLSLLTLKPGLFTGHGRDAAGDIWFDDLGVSPDAAQFPACAQLAGPPVRGPRPHASHKGTWGDVAIIGGAAGMTGAAMLAATSALHMGAGRVYASLLDVNAPRFDPVRPELMFRALETLDLRRLTAVCGCGGGDAVRHVLARVCSASAHLVLDADALNAIAADPPLQSLVVARAGRGLQTVMTPHPLEAARLLGLTTGDVQADRLGAAVSLARKFSSVVVLKGSGSIIAAPLQIPAVNMTGNARLATAGTGDVLAGMIGALLAAGVPAFEAACQAVYLHGAAADGWPAGSALTAGKLASAVGGRRLRGEGEMDPGSSPG
ncbi:MAG: NAD(P)H-hydrate dehydratase [Comamonadaceae bacterium]|nr:MAG: NAD(P)H-hydrate dehydratase [Comamonadaceae bacterium]